MANRETALHFIAGRATTHRLTVTMACGAHGWDEGHGWKEFTTLDSREARMSYTTLLDEVTCKRCIAWLRKNRP